MPVNLAYRAYRFVWDALDWLYPPTCGGCNQPGVRWCDNCAEATPEIAPPFCLICGDTYQSNHLCQRCREARPHFDRLRSHTIYQGPIRDAVHRLKYRRDMSIGEILSRPMIASLEKQNWSVDIVASVPLGLVRFKERGYNQATLLARPIALWLRLPFISGAICRTRETRSQVGLTASERHENMMNAFHASSKLVSGKRVLVVDDVATSGATLDACSKALRDAGAVRVYCFTLARALY